MHLRDLNSALSRGVLTLIQTISFISDYKVPLHRDRRGRGAAPPRRRRVGLCAGVLLRAAARRALARRGQRAADALHRCRLLG